MRQFVIAVDVEMVDVDHAVWCDACLLPAVTSATLAVTVGEALPELMTVTACESCGRQTL